MSSRSPIFVSYAHEDKKYLQQLLTHLEPLRMQDQVCAWSDQDLQPGSNWNAGINSAIHNAKLYVLLISKHFLASDFIRNSELPGLLAGKEKFDKPVIPVLLSPCLYELVNFKYPDPTEGPYSFDLQAVQFFNDPDKPLNALSAHAQDLLLVSLSKKIFELAFPPPPPDYVKEIFSEISADGRKMLTVTEGRSRKDGLLTEVHISIDNKSTGVYAIHAIGLDITAGWKDIHTVTINTRKNYHPFKKWPGVKNNNETVQIEYVET